MKAINNFVTIEVIADTLLEAASKVWIGILIAFARLTKSSSTGHLLKTANGHLSKACGGCDDTCTHAGSDAPSTCMTNAWSDTDTTKTLWGQSWSNGETKTMCPDDYVCAGGNSYERWLFNFPAGDLVFSAIAGFGSKRHDLLIARGARYTTFLFVRKTTGGTTSSSHKVSSHNIDFSGLDVNDAFVTSEFFGNLLWDDGVQTTWTQNGDHWNTCSNT
jgi:hypothetical protein